MAQTLAQLVKSKHPGVYDDIPDVELEAKVTAKYPGAYDDIPRTTGAVPSGLHAAAAGAETIGAAPWYAKPIAGVGPSVLQTLEALPAVGGAIGGMLASPGVVTTAGGAAVGGAGGEAFRQLSRRALGVPAPATSGEAAKGIAVEGAIQGGAQATGGVLGKGLSAGGRRIMHSALKPNPSLLKEYSTTAPKLVKTLLDEGVNVTPGGMEKLQRLFNSTNAEIKEAVKNAQGLIPRDLVAARVAPTAKRMSEQVNPDAALRDVGKSVQEFLTAKETNAAGEVVRVARGPLTVPEAQAMKTGTYQQIGKNYGKLSSASVETQKALARGLKEEIEAAIPKIKALNAREGSLMAAQEAVGHRVAIAGNRDPVGFAWVTNTPQTFLAALFDRSPVVKSMVARGMYASAGKAAKVSPQLIRAAVLALASGESDVSPAPQ